MNEIIDKYAKEFADEYYGFYVEGESEALEQGFREGAAWAFRFFPGIHSGEDELPEKLTGIDFQEEDIDSMVLGCTKDYYIFTTNKERKKAYRTWSPEHPRWRWVITSSGDHIKDEDVLFWADI